ncbi:MAG: hypothetical protein AAF990_14705 [Bacteroidota bacterium]
MDDLNKSAHIAIVRRSTFNDVSKTFDGFGGVREDALIRDGKLRNIPGLSMNLLGGKFEVSHIDFIQKAPASAYWEEGEEISFRQYIECIQYKGGSIPIYFFLSDIHKIHLPYTRKADKVTNKYLAQFEATPPVSNNERYELEGFTIVSHKPNKLNYWHVELDAFDGINPAAPVVKPKSPKKGVDKKSTSHKTQIMLELKELLTTKAMKTLSDCASVPENTYKALP